LAIITTKYESKVTILSHKLLTTSEVAWICCR